jgi:predicted ester cyclase
VVLDTEIFTANLTDFGEVGPARNGRNASVSRPGQLPTTGWASRHFTCPGARHHQPLVRTCTMSDPATLERNKRFVIEHFADFVNNQDLGAIERNMSPDFYDHDGPGGKPTDRDGDRAMMAGMHKLFPDLRVEVKDALAEGDKVMVRNLWIGTNSQSGQRMEFHGFVLWRIADGKIAERWATVTPLQELAAATMDW